MSVELYDDSLVKKFNTWLVDNKIKVMSPNETTELFRRLANNNNDAPITLPLVSLTRESEIEIDIRGKKMMTYDGVMLDATEDKTLQIDAIPMILNYQLDIYAKTSAEADAYMRNFVFKMINQPTVKIFLPYNQINYEHWSNLRLLPTIEDTSDIPQRLFRDQFRRWTIRFTVDDAYLFSLPYVDNVKVEGYEVEIKEE